MPDELVVRPKAREDIVEQALYIAEDSPDAAERFLDAVKHTFDILLATPTMGVSRSFQHSALAGMRMWPIRGFDKHLVFYRPVTDGIEIVRILHAARDLDSLPEETD